MAYDLATYQRELDELLADAGVSPAQRRLERDEYPYKSKSEEWGDGWIPATSK